MDLPDNLLQANTAYREQVDTPGEIVTVYLARFNALDPPRQLMVEKGCRFRTLTELKKQAARGNGIITPSLCIGNGILTMFDFIDDYPGDNASYPRMVYTSRMQAIACAADCVSARARLINYSRSRQKRRVAA